MKNRNTTPRPRRSPLTHIAHMTLLTLITATCGCQVLTYTGPNGERFSRVSVAARTSITSIVVQAGSNGLHRVEVRGYRHDSSQTLAAVAEAAARGAVQGAK